MKHAVVFEGLIPASECDRIIQEGYLYTPVKAAIGFENANGVNTQYRESIVRWIDGNRSEWVRNLIWKVAVDGLKEIRCSDIQIDECAQLQFTTYYGANGGFYNMHHDVDWLSYNKHRKLSIVIQLNQPGVDYEGGEFEFMYGFPDPTISEKMNVRGSVLVFPSYLEHRVNRVTSGVRHSLVSWLEGPLWK